MPKRALIIANGSFKDKRIAPLASPVSDGKRLQALLQRADVGDYQVNLCADADTPAVKIAVERFFDSAGHDDLLVLLISGHGKKDKRGNLYFLTSDTDLDALSATGVEARFFTDRMNESAASRQIVFVDTCYSGAFVKDATFKSTEVDVRADDMLRDSSLADDAEGKAIIMASAGHQLAQERGQTGSEPVQSLFTRHLIEGIESGEADPEGTGRITLDNLYNHCRRGLKRDGAGQEPEWRLSRLSGQFEIARNPVAQAALPQDLLARMARPERDIRAGTIDELRAIAEGADMLQRRRATEALRQLALDDTVLVATAANLALRKLGLADQPTDDSMKQDRERQERDLEAREQRLRQQEQQALQNRLREAEAARLASEQAARDRDGLSGKSEVKPEPKQSRSWPKWAAGGFAAIIGIAIAVGSQSPSTQTYEPPSENPAEPDGPVQPLDAAGNDLASSPPAAGEPETAAADSPAANPPAQPAAQASIQDAVIEQEIQQLVRTMRPMLPMQANEVTKLVAVSGEGKSIFYRYDVSIDPDPALRSQVEAQQVEVLRSQFCNPAMDFLFQSGGRFVAEYRFPTAPGMTVTLNSCTPQTMRN